MVSALAGSAWNTYRALLDGRTLDDRLATLPAEVDPVALVRWVGSSGIAEHIADDPVVELTERAIREAAVEAGVALQDCPVVLGASKGAIKRQCQAAARFFDGDAKDWMASAQTSPQARMVAQSIALGAHGYWAARLQERMGVRVVGQRVAACASSLAALDAARRYMQSPDGPPVMIVATAEAALMPIYIHSYRRLGVLATATPKAYRSYPLDERRGGFRLCELAAAVVLRRASTEVKPKQRTAASVRLVDTAVAGEAYDLIRPDPEMSALARVARQVLAHQPLDVLHPHAPGTVEHDSTELRVLTEAHDQHHGETPAHVYANKGALGHGLGSAGLASLVLAAVMIRAGRVPPMPWLAQPMPLESEVLRGVMLDDQPHTCMRGGTHGIFAAGFGGHVAGAVIAGDAS